jgi:hypothetical protein
MIGVGLFELGVLAAYVGVVAGTIYLVVMLVREWRRGELW